MDGHFAFLESPMTPLRDRDVTRHHSSKYCTMIMTGTCHLLATLAQSRMFVCVYFGASKKKLYKKRSKAHFYNVLVMIVLHLEFLVLFFWGVLKRPYAYLPLDVMCKPIVSDPYWKKCWIASLLKKSSTSARTMKVYEFSLNLYLKKKTITLWES